MRGRFSVGTLVVFAALALGGPAPLALTPPFDFETGNAAIEVIIPSVIPPLFQTTTPNDAPMILRHTTIITNAWFDAIAPCHPTAVGVYSRLGRRPASEAAPSGSNFHNFHAYKAQADEVIAVQAALTDYQKMVAELFDNKISGLGFSALFIAISRGMSLDEFVHYDFLTNVAAFDGGIATWKETDRHDAVRPTSAIRHLYRNRRIQGWGTVT